VVRLTRHARERVDAGEVWLSWIEAAILHPDRVAPDPRRPSVILSFKRIDEFGGRILRVARRPDDGHMLVITAFFDRGAKR
jgi:hypothetical protein